MYAEKKSFDEVLGAARVRGNHLSPLTKLFSLLLIGALFAPLCARAASPVSVDTLVKVTFNKVSVGVTDGYLATIRNVSQQPITGPVSLVVTSISNPKVKLVKASGFTATGQPYVNVPLLKNGLKPGQTTATALAFKKPSKTTAYTFATSVLGFLANANHPPLAGEDRYPFVSA